MSIAAVILSYLVGAIPVGIVLGKMARGIDIRQYGSGKMGTANVTRSLGVRWGIVVLLMDMAKGAAAVYLARTLGDGAWVEVAGGIASVVGHNWSVFLGFSGGRGVSTGLGGLFAIAPLWAAGALGAGLLVIGMTRYVSVGSIAGTTFGGLALLGLAVAGEWSWVYAIYGVVVPVMIIYQHRDNIGRVLRGEERRIGQRAERRDHAGASTRTAGRP